MKYALIVLTHGDSEPLPHALASFYTYVSPTPAFVTLVYDRSEVEAGSVEEAFRLVPLRSDLSPYKLRARPTVGPLGFCRATAIAWAEAVKAPAPWVLYLEHDFLFERPVDLAELARVLDAHHRVAQMALMRNPVTALEREAGGVIESRPGEFEPRLERSPAPPAAWIEHRSYFTTNPSLMRRQFMAHNPWPDYPEECEGRYGLDLLERGYSFGVWGLGDPWVEHVGERTGHGY